jgi:hypothetical protein
VLLVENERNCRNSSSGGNLRSAITVPQSVNRNPLSLGRALPDLASMARPHALPLLAVSAAADAAGLGGPGPIAGARNRIPDVGAARIQELGRWALGKAKESRLAEGGLRFCHVTRG